MNDLPRTTLPKELGLSGTEFVLFGLLFFLIPLANIVVGHVAYHHWKRKSPAKARAINDLSIGSFLAQVIPLLVVAALVFGPTLVGKWLTRNW